MPLTVWPKVLDEYQTINKLITRCSLARYGDGECKVMDGYGYSREPPNRTLAAELREIIRTPMEKLVIGIPTLDPKGPKYAGWLRHKARFLKYLSPDMEYGSSFCSRPDSAPAILTRDYALAVQSLWEHRIVAVVCEPTNKLLSVITATAQGVVHIPCASHGAYVHLDTYAALVLAAQPDLAVLSHGVSATCLAHRLTQQGMQALDLGSIGGMLQRLLLSRAKDHA